MPAKKSAGKAAKKSAKKSAKKTAKKSTKKTAKKTAKKTTKSTAKKTSKEVPKKAAKKVQTKKKIETKKEVKTPAKAAETKKMVECSHCKGVGRCTYGELYDQDRHLALFSDTRLTSCKMCLNASGKSPNSKKLVTCSVCGGSGKVEASS